MALQPQQEAVQRLLTVWFHHAVDAGLPWDVIVKLAAGCCRADEAAVVQLLQDKA